MTILELFVDPLHGADSHRQRAYGMFDGGTFILNPAHCQRLLCWSQEQEEAFVIHAIETGNFGEVLLVREESTGLDYVVDGQHRLNALEKFFNGYLTLNVQGVEVNFANLTENEQREIKFHVLGTVRYFTVKNYDDMKQEVENLYNKFNYSGVKH